MLPNELRNKLRESREVLLFSDDWLTLETSPVEAKYGGNLHSHHI